MLHNLYSTHTCCNIPRIFFFRSGLDTFYSISYMWYSSIAVIVSVVDRFISEVAWTHFTVFLTCGTVALQSLSAWLLPSWLVFVRVNILANFPLYSSYNVPTVTSWEQVR